MGVLALLLVLIFLGSIVLLFRKGQRRRGALGAFVSFSLLGLVASAILDSKAREAGFADSDDQFAAQKAGFPNAADWAEHRASAQVSAAPETVDAPSAAATEEPTSTASAAPAAPPQPTPEEVAAKERELLYGQHCLSLWDGSHPEFVKQVKRRLNDPDSFDHVETVTWPVRDDGRNSIMMTFRAKNGFGGVITSKAMGSINGLDCSDALFVELLD
jgi:hypothetical protein